MVFVMRGTRIKKGFADMKKGEEYIGVIETVTFPNKGRVKLGESSVLVKGGLP
jgi:hypothetical protein